MVRLYNSDVAHKIEKKVSDHKYAAATLVPT